METREIRSGYASGVGVAIWRKLERSGRTTNKLQCDAPDASHGGLTAAGRAECASPFRLAFTRPVVQRLLPLVANPCGARRVPRPLLGRHRGICVADGAIDRLHGLAVGADVQPSDGIADIGGRSDCRPQRPVDPASPAGAPSWSEPSPERAAPRPVCRWPTIVARSATVAKRGAVAQRAGPALAAQRLAPMRAARSALPTGPAARAAVWTALAGASVWVRPAASQRQPFAAPAPSVAPRLPPPTCAAGATYRGLRATSWFRRVQNRDHANVARPVAADRQFDAAVRPAPPAVPRWRRGMGGAAAAAPLRRSAAPASCEAGSACRCLVATCWFRRAPHRDRASVARPVAEDRHSDVAARPAPPAVPRWRRRKVRARVAVPRRPRRPAAPVSCEAGEARRCFVATCRFRRSPPRRSCERCATCCCRSAI